MGASLAASECAARSTFGLPWRHWRRDHGSQAGHAWAHADAPVCGCDADDWLVLVTCEAIQLCRGACACVEM